MMDCNWKEYICMLEKEIGKLVKHEVRCELSHEGEATLHHMMENYKHAKEMMHAHAGGSEMVEKSSYFGG